VANIEVWIFDWNLFPFGRRSKFTLVKWVDRDYSCKISPPENLYFDLA
jgi:hypothetical protein